MPFSWDINFRRHDLQCIYPQKTLWGYFNEQLDMAWALGRTCWEDLRVDLFLFLDLYMIALGYFVL